MFSKAYKTNRKEELFITEKEKYIAMVICNRRTEPL